MTPTTISGTVVQVIPSKNQHQYYRGGKQDYAAGKLAPFLPHHSVVLVEPPAAPRTWKDRLYHFWWRDVHTVAYREPCALKEGDHVTLTVVPRMEQVCWEYLGDSA